MTEWQPRTDYKQKRCCKSREHAKTNELLRKKEICIEKRGEKWRIDGGNLVDSQYLKFEVFEPFMLPFVDDIAITYHTNVNVEWMDWWTNGSAHFAFQFSNKNLICFRSCSVCVCVCAPEISERCGNERTKTFFHFVQREHERARILPILFFSPSGFLLRSTPLAL